MKQLLLALKKHLGSSVSDGDEGKISSRDTDLAEARLRDIVGSLPDLVLEIDRQGNILFINRSQEIHVGKNIRELLPADQQAYVFEMIEKSVISGKPLSFEFQTITPNGQSAWNFVRIGPVKQGDVITSLTVILTDITERKQAEESLRKSEALYRKAIEVADAVPYHQTYHVHNQTVAYDFIGEGIRGITGYSPEEFTEALWDSLTLERVLLDELSVYSFNEAIDRVRTGLNTVWKCNHRIRARDGSIHWVFEAAVELRDQDGISYGSIGMFQDITERKRVDEQIRQLNEELEKHVRDRTAQLEAANKELEAFSYSVSHDLRSPLRTIVGFSKIINDDYSAGLDPIGRGFLQKIGEAGRKMNQLIDDLLAFSRLGRKSLEKRPVDLNEIVRNVIDSLAQETAGRQMEWVLAELPPATADPALLQQVYANLIGNAVKYTSRREAARIEIGSISQGGGTVYFVRDNGAGFDMQFADKVFGVFQRLHRDDEFEGTGIGLAIVERIITRHGGRIWFEAEVDKGATFYFTLQPDIQ
jgi:PAS domain S-box-containing protein